MAMTDIFCLPDEAEALQVTQFMCNVGLELLNLQSPGVIDSLPATPTWKSLLGLLHSFIGFTNRAPHKLFQLFDIPSQDFKGSDSHQ